MTQDAYSSRAGRAGRETTGWAVGFILFAAIMMIMVGVFQAIQLILGLVVAFAGWGLFSGRTWARTVAIVLAVLSAIANFAFIPYYPFWALLIITLDIFVIWAVAAYGGDLRDPV
jgi:hypothetical protein